MKRKKPAPRPLTTEQLEDVSGGATGFNPNAPAGAKNAESSDFEDYDADGLDDIPADIH